jgi:hypothetical protein
MLLSFRSQRFVDNVADLSGREITRIYCSFNFFKDAYFQETFTT